MVRAFTLPPNVFSTRLLLHRAVEIVPPHLYAASASINRSTAPILVTGCCNNGDGKLTTCRYHRIMLHDFEWNEMRYLHCMVGCVGGIIRVQDLILRLVALIRKVCARFRIPYRGGGSSSGRSVSIGDPYATRNNFHQTLSLSLFLSLFLPRSPSPLTLYFRSHKTQGYLITWASADGGMGLPASCVKESARRVSSQGPLAHTGHG